MFLPLKNIDRDIFSKQCPPYLNFPNQPIRYVTDNYLLHTLINNIYLYIYFKFSKHHILHVQAKQSIKTLHKLAFSQCHTG